VKKNPRSPAADALADALVFEVVQANPARRLALTT
jgi:hypothetical protein